MVAWRLTGRYLALALWPLFRDFRWRLRNHVHTGDQRVVPVRNWRTWGKPSDVRAAYSRNWIFKLALGEPRLRRGASRFPETWIVDYRSARPAAILASWARPAGDQPPPTPRGPLTAPSGIPPAPGPQSPPSRPRAPRVARRRRALRSAGVPRGASTGTPGSRRGTRTGSRAGHWGGYSTALV